MSEKEADADGVGTAGPRAPGSHDVTSPNRLRKVEPGVDVVLFITTGKTEEQDRGRGHTARTEI